MTTESQRIGHVLEFARRHLWLQQFGQPNDDLTGGGRTGCGFTVLQFLALLWRGRTYTHNGIARLVGYPNAVQRSAGSGLWPSQIAAFCRLAGLPYAIAEGWTVGQAMRRANLYGPVAFTVRYGDQPEWRGYRYLGTLADGRPNGYASPLGRAGKTQLTGFENGSHLELLLCYHVRRAAPIPPAKYGAVIGRTFHLKDPNHGSELRPEKPPFDDVAQAQFERLFASSRTIGRVPYVLVPTRPLEVA